MKPALVTLALLALVACDFDSAKKCRDACAPRAVRYVSSSECACDLPSVAPAPTGEALFCASCKATCAPAGVKRCSFGNDTWGAGPDLCECGAADGGAP